MTKTTKGEITVGELTEAPALPAQVNGTGAMVHAEPPRSMLELIDRASRDPSFDVGKLAELLAMNERENVKQAKRTYLAAMAKMKPELPVIDRKGHIIIHKKDMPKTKDHIIQDTAFARWEDIDEKITPVLARHGFVITFRAGMAADGKVTVTGILSHVDGHSEETTVPLPHDSSGSKNPVQAVGSALSYGKRYAATFLLNIRTKGEDDDGNAAGAEDPLDATQMEQLQELITRSGANVEIFCDYMEVGALVEIKRKDFQRAIEALNLKLKKKAEKK